MYIFSVLVFSLFICFLFNFYGITIWFTAISSCGCCCPYLCFHLIVFSPFSSFFCFNLTCGFSNTYSRPCPRPFLIIFFIFFILLFQSDVRFKQQILSSLFLLHFPFSSFFYFNQSCGSRQHCDGGRVTAASRELHTWPQSVKIDDRF